MPLVTRARPKPAAVAAVTVACLALAGCGASARRANAVTRASPPPTHAPSTSPVPSSASSAVSRCGSPSIPATAKRISSSAGATLAAYEVGTGTRGVVLVPELGRLNLCGWWDYAARLARRGFRVLIFDHQCAGDSTCPASTTAPHGLMDDIAAATATLRHDGAHRVALVGASQGGSEVVIAGARPLKGVVAIVALSADELTTPLVAPPYAATSAVAARTLALPSLFAVANDDAYVSVADTRTLVNSVPAKQKRLVVLPAGTGHGWQMLTGAGSSSQSNATSQLDHAIVEFLQAELS